MKKGNTTDLPAKTPATHWIKSHPYTAGW